jgi:TP901 family phage tail tape measure protein
MQPFVIPSIFTAVDGMTVPLKGITTSLNGFASNIVKTAAIGTAAIGAVFFSGKALSDYQTEIASLSAITGATGADLDKFKDKIQDVATATKTSSVEVAKAFTAIANNQPELLKDADALAAVTRSSILLAQASKMELQPAGEAVTQILNQYGKGAVDAAKLVDILAAGSVAGSSEIRDTADAIQAFGTVAANAGVQINESVAMIELVSKFEKGTEAGTKLRNVLLEMGKGTAQDPKALASLQRLGVNISLVANSAIPINERLKEMSKIAKDNVAIMQVFGKENAALATGLLNNAGDFGKYLEAVNTTGTAAQMAATNNDTLSVALDQMSGKWVTLLTGSGAANMGLTIVKDTVQFLTDHMDGLVTIVTIAGSAFLAWKGYTIGARLALSAYNFVVGLSTVLTGRLTGAMLENEMAAKGATVALNLLNLGLLGSIGIIGGAVVALALMTNGFGLGYDSSINYVGALEKTKDGFLKLADPITKAQVAMQLYNNELEEYRGLKNFEGHQDALQKKGAIPEFFGGLYDAFRHPFLTSAAAAESHSQTKDLLAPERPNAVDSAATNPAVEQKQQEHEYIYRGQHASNTAPPRIELHINNNSGHDVKIDENGAPGIKVTSTTAAWT